VAVVTTQILAGIVPTHIHMKITAHPTQLWEDQKLAPALGEYCPRWVHHQDCARYPVQLLIQTR
jgi:hypothetical protein